MLTGPVAVGSCRDRKSTRLNSSHTEIYTLSLHDALPIWFATLPHEQLVAQHDVTKCESRVLNVNGPGGSWLVQRSEEHTSELQSHRDLHSFPTRRSSDLVRHPPTRAIGCATRCHQMRKSCSEC